VATLGTRISLWTASSSGNRSDWRQAQRKERELIVEAKAGKLAASRDEFARLPFGEAADRFIADRLPRLAARSILTEKERVKSIKDRQCSCLASDGGASSRLS
jgi:hypothetical protein